jgi:pimeloyl-ACP methyl ester carboxylesterase
VTATRQARRSAPASGRTISCPVVLSLLAVTGVAREPALAEAPVRAFMVLEGLPVRPFDDLQRRFIYFPDTSRASPAARWFPGGRDVRLSTDDGLTLDAWLVPPTGPDRGMAVLYAPGNGGNREGRAGLVAELAARGFTVLSIDYRGYAGNPGSPSEEGVAADARAAVDLLRTEGFSPERTLYLGESLGSGVVARLATTHAPAGIVLRSPFTSLVDVAKVHFGPAVGALMPDKFPVLDLLAATDTPVTVIRGEADDIVPARLSARVAEGVGRLYEQVALPGVGHNDEVMFGPLVAEAVARLADAVEASRRPRPT